MIPGSFLPSMKERKSKESSLKKEKSNKNKPQSKLCTLTETCFSHQNCTVKATSIVHTISVNVAETGDRTAPFSFELLSFIFLGFSVLISLTENVVFFALFSLHRNSKNNGMSLDRAPTKHIENRNSRWLRRIMFLFALLKFYYWSHVLSKKDRCSFMIGPTDWSKEHNRAGTILGNCKEIQFY